MTGRAGTPWAIALCGCIVLAVDPSLANATSRVIVHMVLFMVYMQLLACVAQPVTC
jgi:hypothetical protein